MKTHYSLDIELTLQGPLLTAGGEMTEPGIDAPMARDRYGRFMLPFSLIKGKLLDAMTDLGHHQSYSHEWLGMESARGEEPERGRLWFSDFHTDQRGQPIHADQRDQPQQIIERIQVEPDSGAARHLMLLMIEAPFGYGEEVTFHGTARFIADEAEAKQISTAVEQALRWVPAYGAYRTVGFGRTRRVSTDLKTLKELEQGLNESRRSSQGTPAGDALLPLRLKLDRPLCLVGRRHSGNHFESLETISGAVLKGAVASLLLAVTGSTERFVSSRVTGGFPKLCEHFEQIRFAEARPMPDDQKSLRPVTPPLSTAVSAIHQTGQKKKLEDVARWSKPGLIDGAAPVFLPDWKDDDWDQVRAAFHLPLLPRERRTRTAIERGTGRALDQKLFSYGLVRPDIATNGKNESYVWEGSIGLEKIPVGDQPAVRGELQQLLQFGLPAIGKTRANAAINWLNQATPPAKGSAALSGDVVTITLQTECLMTNPQTVKSARPEALQQAYADYWQEISGGSLNLARFFARQSLYGGHVSKRANHARYEPFLLTDRGSIFVLNVVAQPQAQEWLEKWKIEGLPTPAWVEKRYGHPLWQRCPYLPHAGFGEIAIDLDLMTSAKPTS